MIPEGHVFGQKMWPLQSCLWLKIWSFLAQPVMASFWGQICGILSRVYGSKYEHFRAQPAFPGAGSIDFDSFVFCRFRAQKCSILSRV